MNFTFSNILAVLVTASALGPHLASASPIPGVADAPVRMRTPRAEAFEKLMPFRLHNGEE